MDTKAVVALGAVGLLGLYFLSNRKTLLPPGAKTTNGYTNTSGAAQYVTASGDIVNALGQLIKQFFLIAFVHQQIAVRGPW